MLFNSIDFAVFLPIIFVIYWFLAGKQLYRQNLVLLIASYIFYGWWDGRFLSLILFSTVVDFVVGRQMSKVQDKKKRQILLAISLVTNLGLLGFFKYYNFFVENFIEAFSLIGSKINRGTLNIILPVGISFYTFQTLSYTIDIFRRKLKPTQSFIVFAVYVSFFPQLVAGPIERATALIPQFVKTRIFDRPQATTGLRQILWGLFKKVVIADNCAFFVDMIFSNSGDFNGSTLLIGAVLFAFQIYGDFSGYSDIAIGSAKLFGFDLMRNFAYPYFSRDIAEFWRRWHISLSTWFRDYLYIPLGGSRGDMAMKVRNILIIFIVSGFWHGANWTFLAWGALNAIYFMPLLLRNKNRAHTEIVAEGRIFPTLKETIQILGTFGLTVIAWIFFRANTLSDAYAYIDQLFSLSFFEIPYFPSKQKFLVLSILILVFVVIEWFGRQERFALAFEAYPSTKSIRWFTYIAVSYCILAFGNFNQTEFIYFAF